MQLPSLNELSAVQSVTDIFAGYNHNLRIGDGEFYETENLSSDLYPVLSPRKPRGVYTATTSPGGMIAKDELCYVDGQNIVIGEDRYDLGLSDSVPKQLISFGAYIVILPDKKYINTADTDDRGDMEADDTGMLLTAYCDVDGVEYWDSTASVSEPSRHDTLWIDTSDDDAYAFKAWSSQQLSFIPVTVYLKIAFVNRVSGTYTRRDCPFKDGESVTFSGFASDEGKKLNGTFTVFKTGTGFTDMHGPITGFGTDFDWIMIPCPTFIAYSTDSEFSTTNPVPLSTKDFYLKQSSAIHLKRVVPVLDYVIESRNRLWGCRYGTNADGEFVNEIYASKLGDFKSWYVFQGVSTDSYIASVGSDGPWTGAASYLGYPIFFKENRMHKVYGDYPAQYQIQETECRGVADGSCASLAVCNETLFWLSPTGVVAFNGSLPQEISSAFGTERYRNGIACAAWNKYFISMQDSAGAWNLFVYDSSKGIWEREDKTHVRYCAFLRDELYYIDADDNRIKTVNGSGTELEQRVRWACETGILGIDAVTHKYVSKIVLRMSLALGTYVRFFIQYDSCGQWEHVCSMTSSSLRSFSFPIRPKRCDHFRLRIEGTGDARIFSLARVTEQGSDF